MEATAIKASLFSIEKTAVKATEITVTNTVERIAVQSSKEIIEAGIAQTSTIAIEATKEVFAGVSKEGFETALTYGSKESVKQVTETIVIQQGGKA